MRSSTSRVHNFRNVRITRNNDGTASEWTQQHNKYIRQDMFGAPIPQSINTAILPFLRTYMMKEDPIANEMKK